MRSAADQTIVRLKDFRTDRVSAVRDAVGSRAGQLVDGVRSWTSKARSAAKSTDGFVRSSPWQAAGAVALAGLAAGILVSRSARRARQRVSDPNLATSEVSGG